MVHLLVSLLNARYISYDLEDRLSVALFKAHHISMEGIRNGYLFCQKFVYKLDWTSGRSLPIKNFVDYSRVGNISLLLRISFILI